MSTDRATLLDWYDEHARELPWRKTRDPYAIWVSEVMLQQTRVDTVIPYFERFLARFPTMHALAGATEDEVLSMWSGLGYYRRARFLHRGVAEAVERYGEVPLDAASRRALPGVGAYTAGAIGSIAFDKPEPIVDGNVARVLSRFHDVATPLGKAETTKELWALASRWAEGERPGALNQALMELGATVCTPTKPGCDECPLRRGCAARVLGNQGERPVAAAKKAPVAVTLSAAIVHDARHRAAFVRGDDALFGGLWGVPMVEGGRAELLAALDALGLSLSLGTRRVRELRHVLSHRALTVRVYEGAIEPASRSPKVRFLDEAGLDAVGVSTLTRKILGPTPRTPSTARSRRAASDGDGTRAPTPRRRRSRARRSRARAA